MFDRPYLHCKTTQHLIQYKFKIKKRILKGCVFYSITAYLHSEGTYLAGILPAVTGKDFAVALALVAEAHAQSIVPPTEAAAKAVPAIEGVNTIVSLTASAGKPETVASVAEVTVITPVS